MSYAKVAPLITQNNTSCDDLSSFIESTAGSNHLRVEKDLGDGFVLLKSSEVEKRQAAQDIRSTEDIVIELLRNARDASAKHIFIATQRDKTSRTLLVIDDGVGIPQSMQEHIFEPRVTSKLDTAHMDKWGLHGRGMALYSVAENTKHAFVKVSDIGLGSAIEVIVDMKKLKEKTDQSTFPHFEVHDGIYSMRGPRNILRSAAEFSLEHSDDLCVYCGSFTEIAATIYSLGISLTTPKERAFPPKNLKVSLIKQLAYSCDPEDFASRATDMGLKMSARSARRILDGEIKSLPSLIDRLEHESFPLKRKNKDDESKQDRHKFKDKALSLNTDDITDLQASVKQVLDDISQRYYFEYDAPNIKVEGNRIIISVPIKKLN